MFSKSDLPGMGGSPCFSDIRETIHQHGVAKAEINP